MKSILTATALLAAGLVLGFVFRDPIGEAADAWLTRGMFVTAEAATFGPGPEVGAPFPGIEASHRGRSITAIDEFYRGNGTILIALRSVDWCMYCKRQIIQLQEHEHRFHANGIGIVAITYDQPKSQQMFIDEHGITIPVLSDPQSVSFRNLGILSSHFQPGDPEYGVPHPGAIIVNREGIVVGKLFVEDPSFRVDSREILDFAKQALGLKGLF